MCHLYANINFVRVAFQTTAGVAQTNTFVAMEGVLIWTRDVMESRIASMVLTSEIVVCPLIPGFMGMMTCSVHRKVHRLIHLFICRLFLHLPAGRPWTCLFIYRIKGVVSKETVVLCRWGELCAKIWFYQRR